MPSAEGIPDQIRNALEEADDLAAIQGWPVADLRFS
jgi:hypothetical protein